MKIKNNTTRTLLIKVENPNEWFKERQITQIQNGINDVPMCEGDTLIISEK